MQAPVALLRFAVHVEIRDRIELEPDVDPYWSDWRHVPQPGAHVIAQITEVEIPRVGPDVAVVEKQYRAELTSQGHTHLRRTLDHGVAADRQAVFGERTDLEPAPPSQAR